VQGNFKALWDRISAVILLEDWHISEMYMKPNILILFIFLKKMELC